MTWRDSQSSLIVWIHLILMRNKEVREKKIDNDSIRKKKVIQLFIYQSHGVFTDGLFTRASLYDCLLLCFCLLRCVCIMSGGSSLIRQRFTFDLFQRGANGEQTAARPRLALCLQQYARNFSSISSARPIKAALPKDAEWETLATCVL